MLWRGHEPGNLRAEMTALSAIASATSLARQENQDPAYAEAAGHSPSPTARATTLTATLFSGGRAALAHTGNSRASPLHSGRLRPIIGDHTIRKLATDADLLAPVLARHLDGRPRRPAGIGLRDPRVGGRYLLCSGGLGLAADDRPHFYVLILRAASVGASASWPP